MSVFFSLLKKHRILIIPIIELFLFCFFSLISIVNKSLNILVAMSLSLFFISMLVICIYFFILNFVNKKMLKMFYITTCLISILGLAIYLFVVLSRNMEYVSDHACYYVAQGELHDLFINSHLKGIYSIISSCWYSDYSFFINVFLELLYEIFPKSNDSFVIIYYCVLIVPVFFIGNVFVFNMIDRFCVKHIKSFLLLSGITFLSFPLLHYASLLGMPDIFGLFFIFAIMMILFDLDFSMLLIKRSLCLGCLIVALIITRRWYIFWLIGFIPSWYVVTIVKIVLSKANVRNRVINSIISMALTLGVVVISLLPFIYHTFVERNYQEEYADYYFGGFWYEVINQIGFLGILMICLMTIGLFWGIFQKQFRFLSITFLVGCLFTLWSFTQIQNMGKHQSLCLVPYYLMFLFLFYLFIDKQDSSLVRYSLIGITTIAFLLNVCSTMFVWVDDVNSIYFTTKYGLANRFSWK